ncbi:MAG: hypothetical protein GTO55_10785 [Armatimonadetes bacterium]|nr:hypothetical protein [Armatimonadota bacterium]NIM24717.1 hypothetical protein [Armatimonadota bacterium]NIM68597.1 hypothetical protein [Armatimonadota bacterium]NIM77114.1 hypothetical protein [Armatimonadota bacterium]NIN06791.1 hypothetical protein [Armatimonadota bacterium]
MSGQLIVEKISVEFDHKPGPPVRFIWRGRTYLIERVMKTWADYGFGTLARGRRWWQRRHRNYYQVVTEEGEEFEFYLDRGKKEWILYRRLSGE